MPSSLFNELILNHYHLFYHIQRARLTSYAWINYPNVELAIITIDIGLRNGHFLRSFDG